MVRTQIQLTEAQARAVKRAAMKEGTSAAEVIRRAVEKMAEARPKISAQERVRRAFEIAGKFRSGKKDVSRKHDEYLAEAYE
jgi:Arc/MetJ-type ribon-helix-helix transcriptional regulator